MSNTTKHSKEAREGLLRGISILADAVSVTLGPNGRNVVFHDKFHGTRSTKDGVTVARMINPTTNEEKMGADIIREAASNTADKAGDGTTTSTIIARALVEQDLELSPIKVKRELDLLCENTVNYLRENTKEIDLESVKHVATISSNNDEKIGEILYDAYKQIGLNGVLTVEESPTAETYVDVIKGMQYDRGYLSPYFVTDTDTHQCIYEDIYLVVCNTKVSGVNDVMPVIEFGLSHDKPVLLICDEIDDVALKMLVANKLQSGLRIVAIKSPGHAKGRQETMLDIAVLTGATLITDKNRLSDFRPGMQGTAERCVVTSDNTLIINGGGDPDYIQGYLEGLAEMKASTEYERKRYEHRVAQMTNGVGVIYVGANSEFEMKEKKDRVEDAKEAVKAAIRGGILPGGGVALYKASHLIKLDKENPVHALFRRACQAPLLQLCKNSDKDFPLVVTGIDVVNFNHGYNFKTDEYCDLIEEGVVDPADVTISALENAISVAGMFLLTECLIVKEGDQDEGLPDFLKPN